MGNFSMTCTCGHVISAEGQNREEAVQKVKALMNEEGVAKHFAEKHPGQPVPPVSQVHAMIEQTVVAA